MITMTRKYLCCKHCGKTIWKCEGCNGCLLPKDELLHYGKDHYCMIECLIKHRKIKTTMAVQRGAEYG